MILSRLFKDGGANKAGVDTINLHLALLFMLGGLFLQIKVRQIK
jgi:putative transposase